MGGAFLHKKSLLDQFKDDYAMTDPIKARRAERSWGNPIVRHKREKGIQDWAKSFAGKRHYRKLMRFNAMRNESTELSVYEIVDAIGRADFTTRSEQRPFNVDIDDKEYAVDVWLESKETGEDYHNPSWRVLIAQKFIGTYETDETGNADVVAKTPYKDAKDIESFFVEAFKENMDMRSEAYAEKTAWSYLEELEKLEGEDSRMEATEKVLRAVGCEPGTEGRWYDKDGEEVDIIDVLDNTEWAFAQKVCGQLQEAKQAKKIYPKFVQINTQRDFDKYIKPALDRGADAYGLSDIEGMWWEIADGERVPASAKTMREIRDSVSKRPRFIFISGVGAERGIADLSLTEYAREMGMTVEEYLDGYDAGSWESKKSEDSLDDFDNRHRVSPSSKYITFSGLARGAVRDDVRRVLHKSGILDPQLGKPGDSVRFEFGVQNNPRSVRKALAALLELGERNTWYIKYNDGDSEHNRITMYSPDIPNDMWYAGDVDKIVSYIMPVKSEAVDETLDFGNPSFKPREYEGEYILYTLYGLDSDGDELDDIITSPKKSTVIHTIKELLPDYRRIYNSMHVTAIRYDKNDHMLDSEVVWSTDQYESKGADETIEYEKGNKNSRGEDAPWVIRDHKGGKVLASFAKKADAEAHLERMQRYSKSESTTSGRIAAIKDAIADAARATGLASKIVLSATNMPKLFVDVYQGGIMGDGINWEVTGNLSVRRYDKQDVKRAWRVDSLEELEKSFEGEFQQLKDGKFEGMGNWDLCILAAHNPLAKDTYYCYDLDGEWTPHEDNAHIFKSREAAEKAVPKFVSRLQRGHLGGFAAWDPKHISIEPVATPKTLKKTLHESRAKKLERMGEAADAITSRDVQAAARSAWSASGAKDFKLDIVRLGDHIIIYAKGPDGEDNIGIDWHVHIPSELNSYKTPHVEQFADWGSSEREPERTYDAKDLDDLEDFFLDEFKALQETIDVGKETSF